MPTGSTPAERRELSELARKLEPGAFAGAAANHLSPVPLPKTLRRAIGLGSTASCRGRAEAHAEPVGPGLSVRPVGRWRAIVTLLAPERPLVVQLESAFLLPRRAMLKRTVAALVSEKRTLQLAALGEQRAADGARRRDRSAASRSARA